MGFTFDAAALAPGTLQGPGHLPACPLLPLALVLRIILLSPEQLLQLSFAATPPRTLSMYRMLMDTEFSGVQKEFLSSMDFALAEALLNVKASDSVFQHAGSG